MPRFFMTRLVASGRVLLLGLAALISSSAPANATKPVDWTRHVTLSPIGGHILGNPAARTRIVEYVSYTCPHCGHFVAEATAPLKADYISGGTVSAEVRNAVRDRYDLVAALLARCGGPTRFYGNHEALFANQQAWFPQLEAYDTTHRDPVPEAKRVAMFQDIGRGTGLYALMAKRGFTPSALDACLADAGALKQVLAMTQEAFNTVRIPGTPGFTINGVLIDGASWDALKAALTAPLPAPLPAGPK